LDEHLEEASEIPILLEGMFNLVQGDPTFIKKEAKEILSERRLNQPTQSPNAGCFFKNPLGEKTAGELIEMAGLKGKQKGGAEISTKHANFIVNKHNATARDILALKIHIEETVSKLFNVDLEPEVRIIGE
jgi:UDP-N-acetylmuramate dehydrogenase